MGAVSRGEKVKIIRVFPRRTNATPTDELAFCGSPDLLTPGADEIHISVTFTYDIPRAEQLATEWKYVGPVKLGGPAFGQASGEFVPGRYLKHGYVITSRGCPNSCWFCSVPKREGNTRELKITEGWNVLDDNLLACADVFEMLSRQKEKKVMGASFFYLPKNEEKLRSKTKWLGIG